MSTKQPTEVTHVAGRAIEYRFRPGRDGEGATVVLPGAHMSAACCFGEERYVPGDRALLVISRPGYGRTALRAGRTPIEFAARVASLIEALALSEVTAMGISMGARTAVALTVDRPDLVRRLVLCCPVSQWPWPDAAARRRSRLMFGPGTQALIWALLRVGLRHRPDPFLRAGLRSLSALPSAVASSRLGADAGPVIEFLRTCRSGRGFVNDLADPGVDRAAQVRRSTLVLSTCHDGAVTAEHPQALAEAIPGAVWVDTQAPSHLLWWGDRAEVFARELRAFEAG